MTLLLIALTQISIPLQPNAGFAFDNDGSILATILEGETVKIGRFAVDGNSVRRTHVYPFEFKGKLEILPKKSGFVIADYESGLVTDYAKDGKVIWQRRLRYPMLVKLDTSENIWAMFNSGYIMRKTPDSSEFEFILDRQGREISEDFAVALVPQSDGSFYTLQEDGEIRFFGADRRPKTLATIPCEQIIPSKLGGVIGYKDGVIRHVSPQGNVRVLAQVPQEVYLGNIYVGRTHDGRIVLGKASGKADPAGIVYLLDANVER